MTRAHSSSKHFTFMFWFDLHNNPIRYRLYLYPFIDEKTGTERLYKHMSLVTFFGENQARCQVWAEKSWIRRGCSQTNMAFFFPPEQCKVIWMAFTGIGGATKDFLALEFVDFMMCPESTSKDCIYQVQEEVVPQCRMVQLGWASASCLPLVCQSQALLNILRCQAG